MQEGAQGGGAKKGAGSRARAQRVNAPNVLLREHLRVILDELGQVRVHALKHNVQVLKVEQVHGGVIDARAGHVQQLDNVRVLQRAQNADLCERGVGGGGGGKARESMGAGRRVSGKL